MVASRRWIAVGVPEWSAGVGMSGRLLLVFFLVWVGGAGSAGPVGAQNDPAPAEAAVDWQEFRGPAGSGVAGWCLLPDEWNEEAIAWKAALPGRGWSSPVISGEQIWLTAAIEKGPETTDSQTLKTVDRIELIALCVDAGSGAIRHQVELFRHDDPVELHPLNSYASPTPVIAGDRVICSFGDMGIACIGRSSGRVLWKADPFDLEHETGPGSSPVVWQDRVLLHLDGTDRQSVAALDLETGRVLWETPRSGELHPEGMMKKAFCTPLVLDVAGQPVVVSPGANHVYGYDPADGRELWRLAYGKLGFSNVPRPVFHDGLVFVCTGFNRASLLAIRPGSSPDSAPERVWQYDQKVPTMPSPLVFEGRLYMVSDDGIATALNASSGSRIWQSRLGGNYSASPVVVGGKLVFANCEGEVRLLEPGDSFRQLAVNQLDGAVMATPVPCGNSLIVRTVDSLYRIRGEPAVSTGKYPDP